jgi:hypothetical protein
LSEPDIATAAQTGNPIGFPALPRRFIACWHAFRNHPDLDDAGIAAIVRRQGHHRISLGYIARFREALIVSGGLPRRFGPRPAKTEPPR